VKEPTHTSIDGDDTATFVLAPSSASDSESIPGLTAAISNPGAKPGMKTTATTTASNGDDYDHDEGADGSCEREQWYDDMLMMAYWVGRGVRALEMLGIEVVVGVDGCYVMLCYVHG